MMSQIRSVARHYRNFAQLTAEMLFPTRASLELGVRGKMSQRDMHLEIPSLHLRDMFPLSNPPATEPIKLLPGTALDGGPNIYEQFILCALVQKVKPKTVLEIGTFRGGTTWHIYENAPPDTVIYTLDLPDNEVPGDVTNLDLAANKARPFLPSSDRIHQILVNSQDWKPALERKVQFAFIDADHSYKGIRNDTEKALTTLDDYACIAWHDSLESDYGYGTLKYLLELTRQGWKIFRIRSMHEISGITMWMSDTMLKQLNVPEPRFGPYMFRDYVGR
jgi:Methyltransferase domain